MQIMWVLKVLFGLLVIKAVESKSVNEYSIALPGCQKSCGYVKIPYPFGIGSNCSMNEGFAITCNYSSSTTVKPYLANTTLEVLGIALTGQIRISSVISSNCSSTIRSCEQGVNLSVTPFVFSADQNRFTATGCDNFAILVDYRGLIIGGCLSMCNSTKRWLEMHPIHRLLLVGPPKTPGSAILPRPIYSNWVSNSSGSGCYGINCCQMTIPPDIKSFKARMGNPFNDSSQSNGSISSFMVEQSWFEESLEKNGSNYASQMKFAPAVLDWGKWKGSCDINSQESEDVFCTKDYCWKKLSDRFLCVCSNSSLGDNIYPIATEGCKGKSECLNLKNADCGLLCMHTPGSSNCAVCPDGYRTYVYSSGQITCFPRPSYYDGRKKSKVKFVLIGCGSGLGSLLSLMGMWWLYKIIKRRKETKLKQKFFKRNGGLLLEQQLSSTENNVERTQLFTSRDLEKATDHYNTNRILGQGGQGTVYKGMLTDGKIVAVKKSTLIDEHKPEAFINEVVILSQVNHRNVVKLLGCCLETQVPLLVYEFIPNGTLFQYIHDPSEEFPLTWKLRLRIATEVSGALSYLHSAASMPIYHRDIKSTNILLDEKYRAKVSDFGISRAISIDQTHLTTKVQGTFGYLDPEYFQSSQFTEKSDVYSFGVVLVELLTGQKPISYTRSAEQRSLAIYFLESMEENRLLEILDERVLKEGGKKEIIAVAGLAKRCLNLNGKKRPPMKTIAVELERLRSSEGNYSGTKQDYEEVDVSVGDMPAGPWESTSTSFGSYSNGFSATNVPLDVHSLPLLNTR